VSAELAVIEETRAELSETGLTLPDDLTEREWSEIGSKLSRAHKASAWWIGDWINYGEGAGYVSREKYERAEQITGLTRSVLWQYAWVSRTFPIPSRATSISFSIHRAIAAAPETRRDELLERAAEEGWSSRNARELIAEAGVPLRISRKDRHPKFIATAEALARVSEKWEREMTDELTPPDARKQLTILRKAEAALAEVIEAVEYRAATLHQFNH
jgi:hypothetical protein